MPFIDWQGNIYDEITEYNTVYTKLLEMNAILEDLLDNTTGNDTVDAKLAKYMMTKDE